MTVVDEIRQRVEKRIAELEPLVAEYEELIALRDGIGSVRSSTAPKRTRRRAGSSGAGSGRGRRGGRAEQALALIGSKPGVTVKEIASHMGINDNYLYRLLPRMEKEGKLKRQGKGWAVK